MMLKELLKILFRYKYSLNVIKRYKASNICNMMGVNDLKREIPIIVSMSAKEEDFDELELSLYSIFEQTVMPDRVILWLSKEYELSELPYSITRYIKNGLEIKFIEDKGSYNKIIYALKDFSNSILVTANTNFYYPKDWLKKLYHSYISAPNDIHVHQAKIIKSNNKLVLPMKTWCKNQEENSSYKNFPIQGAGVLYPPKCFSIEVFREDIYEKKINADWKVWSWFMALVSGRKIRIVKNHIKRLDCVNLSKQIKKDILSYKNIDNIDTQISGLMKYYSQNLISKLK